MIKSVINVRDNARLIADVATLWIKDDDVVMDVTYGRGLWWTVYQPRCFIAHDLFSVDDHVDFRHLPEPDASIDVVAFDPPYTSKGGRETSGIDEMDDRYGLADAPGTPDEVDQLIAAGIVEAARVLKPGGRLLAKVSDYISSGKYHQGHHHAVTAAHGAGLVQVDEFIHHSGTGPQPKRNLNGTLRRQVHSRRSHSFLIVFRKPPTRTRRTVVRLLDADETH